MKQVIRGESVSAAELKSIPEEQRLYWADALPHLQITREKFVRITKKQSIAEEAGSGGADETERPGSPVDEIESRKDNVIYECPEGSDVTERVVSACASGAAVKVIVECMHNTWARYPCRP